MKTFLMLFVVLVLCGGSYAVGRIQSRTVIEPLSATWAEGDDAARAWRELLLTVESAAAEVASGEGDRVEAYAYLADLLSASLEMKVANGDLARPDFTDWMASGRKFLGDSPDATYHSVEVSGRHAYRITGRRGDAGYLGIMAYGRALNGWNRAAASLSLDDISMTDGGRFEIVASADDPGGGVAWLPLEEDVHMLMVRRYRFGSESTGHAPASLAIERIDREDVAETPIAERLRAANRFFLGTFDGTQALAAMVSKHPNDPDPPPSFNQDFGGVFYPTNDNTYLGTWMSLKEGQGLEIEGEVPDAIYWSASLQNRWLQSFDGPSAAMNHAQIETRDGRYRIVVSAEDPGVANWLDTDGRSEGLLAIRYLMDRKDTPKPTIRVVELDEAQASR